MGVVWLAEHKSLGRKVALKLLRPGLADAAMLKRFRQEAAILERLQHPGIAQIHNVGTAENEQPFFAMEYVEGVPLDEFARRLRLDRDARLELVARVAEAVAHAHGKGVIHRDLKPDNILVTRDDSYVYRLAFSPDGRQLVSASGDNTLRVWDTELLRSVLLARQASKRR